MQKKFLSNLVLIILLNLLIKPVAIFGIDAQVQNEVGASEYGFYFSLLNFTFLFNILLDFGISNFNIKYMAQYPHLAKQYIGKIFPLRLILFLVYVIFSLGLAFTLGYNSKQFQVLYILLLNQFFISVIMYFRSYFAGLLFLKIDILLSVLDKFLLILLVGYFLYIDTAVDFSIQLFVILQAITLFLTLLIALVLLFAKIGFPIIKWHWSFNRLILKKSFPYALLIVLMMLYNRIDSVMLERLLPDGKFQAGIYAQAFRLLDAFFMFAMLFSNILFPLFSKIIHQKKEAVSLLQLASNILLPGALVVACCSFVDWQFILDLCYQNEIQNSGQVFKILMFSFIPMCITLLFGTLLTVNGNLTFLNWISFIGIIFNVVLNLILIPKNGAVGATYTNLITQSIVALAQLLYVLKVFEINTNFILISKYFGLIFILILTPLCIHIFDLQVNKSLLMLLFSFIYLISVKLFDLRSIPLLFKKD